MPAKYSGKGPLFARIAHTIQKTWTFSAYINTPGGINFRGQADTGTGLYVPGAPGGYNLFECASGSLNNVIFNFNSTFLGQGKYRVTPTLSFSYTIITTGVLLQGQGSWLVLTGAGPNANVICSAANALRIASGTTAQRPATPVNGDLRYNSTLNVLEGYENGAWRTL